MVRVIVSVMVRVVFRVSVSVSLRVRVGVPLYLKLGCHWTGRIGKDDNITPSYQVIQTYCSHVMCIAYMATF